MCEVNRLIHHLIISSSRGLLTIFSLENCPSVLVQLDGRNDNIARVDTNRRSSTIGLVTLYTVDVDDPFLAVHLGNLAFPTLVFAPYDPDLIVLANGE